MEENQRFNETTEQELNETALAPEQETAQELKTLDRQILAKMYEERTEALKKIIELEKRVEGIRNKLSNQELTPAQIRKQIAYEHRDSLKTKEDVQTADPLEDQEQIEWEEKMNERLDQIKETGAKLTTNATAQFDQFKHKASDSINTLNTKMEEDPQTTIKQILAAILMLIGLVTVIRNIFKS